MAYTTKLENAPILYQEIHYQGKSEKEILITAAYDAIAYELGVANDEMVSSIKANFDKAFEVYRNNPKMPILGLKAIDSAADKAVKAYAVLGSVEEKKIFSQSRPIIKASRKRKAIKMEAEDKVAEKKSKKECIIQ